MVDLDRTFKFNTSFLKEPILLAKMQDHWNTATRLATGEEGWQIWVAAALKRIKEFCQITGKTRAQEKINRERQLRAIVASAECLLEEHPSCNLLQDRLNEAFQELVKKEQVALEWASIRSSAKWSQIEGRMSGEFFSSVSVASANTPIQLLQDVDGMEYSTTEEMARYANNFYQTLFTSQGASPACQAARGAVWSHTPKVVTASMNSIMTSPVTIPELREAMHSLPAGKAPGADGF
jgi:hypothetical protein